MASMRTIQPFISTLLSRENRSIAWVALVLLFLPQTATALDVTLAWDGNSGPGIGGYKVFMRQEGETYEYRRPEWTGRGTSCTIRNLDDETNYCFVVRALGPMGAESGNSNEACTFAGTACAGSAEASEYGSNPVYRPSDLGKQMAYLLCPLAASIGLMIWRKKK